MFFIKRAIIVHDDTRRIFLSHCKLCRKSSAFDIRIPSRFAEAICKSACFEFFGDSFIDNSLKACSVFAYQLAVSYDDALMGVTRVVRARDLMDSTPKQIWLMEQLGYPPLTYCHGPLLVAGGGRKMSKRDGDLNMEALRRQHTPETLCGKLAYLAGLLPEPAPIKAIDLVPLFSWDKVKKDGIFLPDGLF